LKVELDDFGDAKSRRDFPALLTAAVAAFSQDSLLVPTSSITL